MKLKSRKTTQKRFQTTGSGKIRRKRGATSHLRRKETTGQKHRKNRRYSVAGEDAKKVKQVIGL